MDKLQNLYRSAAGPIRSSFSSDEAAAAHYGRYLDFVSTFAKPQSALLDVGCGTAWTSYFFARAGFQTTALDLNPSAFEVSCSDRLSLVAGSALQMPFAAASFDVVAAYQSLEHTPDPRQVLEEMLRVVKPGGVIFVVGPNLLSIGASLRAMTKYVWRNRPLLTIMIRRSDMPRHPHGNTLPEVACILVANIWRILRKKLSHRAIFTMREPDVVPPFHADNDATYLSNPIDLASFFRGQGCTILRDGALGRSTWLRMIAGGTWIAARKGH